MIRRGVFMLISASSTTGFSVVTTNQVLTVFSSGRDPDPGDPYGGWRFERKHCWWYEALTHRSYGEVDRLFDQGSHFAGFRPRVSGLSPHWQAGAQ